MKQLLQDSSAFSVMLFTLMFLLIISKIPDNYRVNVFGMEYKLKKVDMLLDVKADSTAPAEEKSSGSLSRNSYHLAGSLFAILRSGEAEKDAVSLAATKISCPMPDVPKIENAENLKNFFQAMKSAGSKKVRIAHYGDSGIEGDNISSDLRKNLQAKFGGNGVGIVGITPVDIQFRTTTNVKFSPDWKTASIRPTENPAKLPIGINGYVYQPIPNSWVSYEASGRYNVKSFALAKIFYVSDKKFSVKYSFDNKPDVTVELKASPIPAEFVLDSKGKARIVKITVVNPAKTYFYGVSLEETNGIYVDNFPLRGITGQTLKDIDPAILKNFNKLLNYKLIILNFGLNVVDKNAEQKDFVWYENLMASVISQYKETFPEASFLLVSVQDMTKNNGTDERVIKLVDSQRKIANKAGIAFFDLYKAMGGKNSLLDWVEKGLAAKGEVHLKLDGYKKLSELIFNGLMDASNTVK